ncbi:hemicentin-1-like [Mizuhopecten yessoensis]|uniref:hemicentin-1-like n=1 Tax=Mizuhopecten yessoensis TaxID=6573 RepID=UPI000B457E71|nr:hemicentin-1-like [Mizuhopecten yessoensis]
MSNTYIYPDSDDAPGEHGYWYDNADRRCKFTELHCKGEAPGEPVIEYEKDEVNMGNTLKLCCTVVGGIPKPTIGWNRQDKALQTKEGWTRLHNKVVFNGNTFLTLSSDDNNVRFSCVVNYKGNDSYYERGVTLNVLYPPIMTVPNYVEVNEKDDVILECHVTSNPPPTIRWIWPAKREMPIGTTLNLNNVYRTAIGSYTCRAENVFRKQKKIEEKTTMLYINAPPKMCLYQHEFTAKNDTLEMICSATGVPTPKLTWFSDSKLINITNSTNHIIESVVAPDNPYLVRSMLTVSGVGDGDLLGYRCSVTNDNGVTQKTFRIHRKLKCRCLSRLLKNCVPLEFEPEHLAASVIQAKEKLSVKKDELTSNKRKLISSNDNRSSASAIGLLGVGILVTLVVVLIGFDLIGYFVIKPHLKHSSKTKKRKQTNSRTSIEALLSSNRSRCQTDGDIQLTDINDIDQQLSRSDQQNQTSTVSKNPKTTTAVVHVRNNPTIHNGQ